MVFVGLLPAAGFESGAFAASTTHTRTIIQTTLGPRSVESVGIVLSHEHIFTDLRGPTVEGYAQGDVEDVARVMLPHMQAAKARGVDLLVECTSIGVGRNAPILAELSRRSGLAVVVPTGVYGRAEFIPADYGAMSEADLEAWMLRELTVGIDETGIKAGFMKLASDVTPLTEFQTRQLRAAAKVSKVTGAAIAIHTPSGALATAQADYLEAQGLALDRFIWVHAQSEPDMAYHTRLGGRGVWMSFDGLREGGAETIARHLALVENMKGTGLLDRVMLSHDSGWYQPGKANGGDQVSFNTLTDGFIPALKGAGYDEGTVRNLTVENPARAFAMFGKQY